MTEENRLFLELLKSALRGNPAVKDGGNDRSGSGKEERPLLNSIDEESDLVQKIWEGCLQTAEEQSLLPFILDTIYQDPGYRALDAGVKKQFRDKAVAQSIRQITQTNEFLTLILHAQLQGLDPIVLKGVTVRELYPRPYLRPSVDEDLLIPTDKTEEYHRFLLSEGLFCDEPDADRSSEPELSYHKENSPTYIELHKSLFDPESKAYGDLNALFPDLFETSIRVQIEDVSVRTLEPGAHLLYLFLHAFKHFVHSGIGIRPVCDIGMFAEHYADDIDWDRLRDRLETAGAFYYGKALLRIVQVWLLPEAKFFDRIADWDLEEVETEPLLEDILAGGVHGNSSLTRLHSSNMTLQAVENRKNDKKRSGGTILYSLFPPLDRMAVRYPYLKTQPHLLPAAWAQRLLRYAFKERRASDAGDGEKEKREASAGDRGRKKTTSSISDALASKKLGDQRIQLLKKYKIVD